MIDTSEEEDEEEELEIELDDEFDGEGRELVSRDREDDEDDGSDSSSGLSSEDEVPIFKAKSKTKAKTEEERQEEDAQAAYLRESEALKASSTVCVCDLRTDMVGKGDLICLFSKHGNLVKNPDIRPSMNCAYLVSWTHPIPFSRVSGTR